MKTDYQRFRVYGRDGCMGELQAENAALLARVARLEEALTQILGWRELRDMRAFPAGRVEEIARRALEEKP